MIPARTNGSFISRIDRCRPRFFFEREWRWHVLLMLPLVLIANSYFIGISYFTDLLANTVGTVLTPGLYWLTVVLLSLTVRWVIRQYPGMQQTMPRTLVMFISTGGITVGLSVAYVWLYSLLPVPNLQFSWAAIRPVWIVGLVCDAFLCIALGLFYTYTQWQLELQDDEQLQRQALQNQYDTLKGQLNPHFLFNALNSISVLIGEEPQQAEQFVDKMARVYRYMLQNGPATDQIRASQEKNEQNGFVTLQAELAFINLYADLLRIRYRSRLRIEQPPYVSSLYLSHSVLPLSLLTLIDNAVKHNTMSVARPLVIRILVTPEGWLEVVNNRQQRTIRVETIRSSLVSLMARYDLLSQQAVLVEATDDSFKVSLPLLSP